MPVTGNRAWNLALGLNLGWLQQGAGFGGRPVHEMTADLERIRLSAGHAGYSQFNSYVDVALTKLNTNQPPASVLPEVEALSGLFQGGSAGQAAEALGVGIRCGWVQQGARAGNRPVPMAIDDLGWIRNHAGLAGYRGFEGPVETALAKLRTGAPIGTILQDSTALVGLFQGQG